MYFTPDYFAFGLGPIRSAQPRREAPVAREVQEHWVPDRLPALVGLLPHSFHAVVQDLLRYSAQLPEGFLVLIVRL